MPVRALTTVGYFAELAFLALLWLIRNAQHWLLADYSRVPQVMDAFCDVCCSILLDPQNYLEPRPCEYMSW